MGLEDRMTQPVGCFRRSASGAYACNATYNPPSLLLLDEHTAALTPALRKRC
jgi:putative ABC transport system ATP-binding protein